MKCSKCGNEIPENSKFCLNCGEPIKLNYIVCPNCGKQLPVDSLFCDDCGLKLKEDSKDNGKTIANSNKSNSKKLVIIICVALSIAIVAAIIGISVKSGQNNNTNSNNTDHVATESKEKEDTGADVEASTSGDIEIQDSGYSIIRDTEGKYYVSYGLIIKNNGSGLADKSLSVKITGRDKNGDVINTNTDYFLISIKSGETAGISSTTFETFKIKPTEVNIDINYDPSLSEGNSRGALSVKGLRIDKEGDYSNIVGDVINNTGIDFTNGQMYLIYRKGKKIVGGDLLYVTISGKRNAFSETVENYKVLSDSYEAYAVGWN